MLKQLTFGENVGLPNVMQSADIDSDIVYCIDLNENRRRGDCVQDTAGNYWSDPALLADCDDCGDTVACDELEHGNCTACEENYTDCCSCDDHIHKDDAIYEEGSDWCQSCHSDTFTCCERCNDTVRSNDAEYVDGDVFCSSCYENNYFRCQGCDNVYHNDSRYSDDDGDSYCEGCMPESDGRTYNVTRVNCSDECKEMRSKRKFGVELETHRCGRYSDWVGETGWGVKRDGSIEGMEFVSPVLSGDDGLASVRKVTGYMDSDEYEVHRSCGFHLHCDLSDTNAEQRKAIALAYCYSADVWELFVATHRRDNQYCRKNEKTRHENAHHEGYWDRKKINDGSDYPQAPNRYVWLNWRAFEAHGTVEVRSHEATLDGSAICNWVKAHVRFIDFVRKMTPAQVTRVFGGKTKEQLFSEISKIWDDAALTAHYKAKSGIGSAVADMVPA